MSAAFPFFSPDGSNDLYNSETVELFFSANRKPTIWYDSTDEIIELEKIQKLNNIFTRAIKKHGSIKINTPPDTSPSFLPKIYDKMQTCPDDLSQYLDFEDYIQKNFENFNV